MNPQDQKSHTKVTDILAHRQETLEKSAADALDAAAKSIRDVAAGAKALVDDERYDRLLSKLEQDDALADVRTLLQNFTRMSLYYRLRWVLTGKL